MIYKGCFKLVIQLDGHSLEDGHSIEKDGHSLEQENLRNKRETEQEQVS